MKIYSSYRREDLRVYNTMKNAEANAVLNRKDKVVRNEVSARKSNEREHDSWTRMVSRRMKVLGEKLSGFFYPEVIE